MSAYFAYYCVSTQKQGTLEQDFEAQQAAVVSFLKGDQPQGKYVEEESGKKNKRPQLLAAIAAARAIGEVLRISLTGPTESQCLTLRDAGWTTSAVTCPMPIPLP